MIAHQGEAHEHHHHEEEQKEEIKPIHRQLSMDMVKDVLQKGIRKTIKTKKMARMEDIITSKVKVEFEEDFYAMTILCYLKSNAEKYHITIDK